jgi:two-component system nitrate/nitrite response regulator NarL
MVGSSATEKVRVVIGDDHPLFRDGVVRALTSSGAVDVVAEAADGASALALIKTHRPHVALLDYRMPHLDGAQVAAAVRRDSIPTRVLLLSAHDDAAIVYQALQGGAAGFMPKESTRSEIVNAVLDCAKGLDVLSAGIAGGLAQEIRRRAEPPPTVLSRRERAVLDLIASGRNIPAVAEAMRRWLLE